MEVNGNDSETGENSLRPGSVTHGCNGVLLLPTPSRNDSSAKTEGESNSPSHQRVLLLSHEEKNFSSESEEMTPLISDENSLHNASRKTVESSICYPDGKYISDLETNKNGQAYLMDTTGAHSDSTGKLYTGEPVVTSSDVCSLEGTEVVPRVYRGKSDSSVSDLSNLGTDSDVDVELEEIFRKGPHRNQPVCHGELSLKDLPPIEDLRISVSQEEVLKVGKVTSIVQELVVVLALPNTPALDLGSILFVNHGSKSLGKIFDVFGPVVEPYYSVRFNSEDHARSSGVHEGMEVFCAPKSPHTSYIFISEMVKMKGSDASWEHNNEPPVVCLDYSDDEEERNARKRHSNQRKGANKDCTYLKRRNSGSVSNCTQESSSPHHLGSPNLGCFPGERYEPDGHPNPGPPKSIMTKKPLLPYPNASTSTFSSISPASTYTNCVMPPSLRNIIMPPPNTTPRILPPPQSPPCIRPHSSYSECILNPLNSPIQNHLIPLNLNRSHPPGHPPLMFSPSPNFSIFHQALGNTPHVGFGSLPHPGQTLNVRQPLLPTPRFTPPRMSRQHRLIPSNIQLVESPTSPSFRVFPLRRNRFPNPTSVSPSMPSYSGQNVRHFELRPSSLNMFPPGVNSPNKPS